MNPPYEIPRPDGSLRVDQILRIPNDRRTWRLVFRPPYSVYAIEENPDPAAPPDYDIVEVRLDFELREGRRRRRGGLLYQVDDRPDQRRQLVTLLVSRSRRVVFIPDLF